MTGTRVYVGGIPRGTRERDLENFFRDFRLKDILLKNTFAFIEFESSRDADDAIYEMNGVKLLDKRVTVEMAKSTPRGRTRSPTRRYKADHRSREGQGGPIRTKHRAIVENVSSSVSWQALKDYMRQAGEVTYGDAHRPHRNVGMVEFASRSDLKAAIKLLDGTELNGRRIRIVEDDGRNRDCSSSRSRSRNSRSLSRGSRRRTRSRSRTRSPSRDGSSSRSRSPRRVRSRSPTRSARRTRSPSHTRSPSRTKSCDRVRSHSRARLHSLAKSSSRNRPRSRRSRGSHSSVGSSSRSRSRSCSAKRGAVRRRRSQNGSRSRSSASSDDSRVHTKKRSRTKSVLCSPTKRLKSVRRSHDSEHSAFHKAGPEDVSPPTVQSV